MEIQITKFNWILYDGTGRPIAKSHINFRQKRSTIAAAKRMKAVIRLTNDSPTCEECEDQFFPIYNITNKSKKVLIDGCNCSRVIPV